MMLKKIAAAAALLAAAPAFAAIASGTSGNGELFLVVQDTTAKVGIYVLHGLNHYVDQMA